MPYDLHTHSTCSDGTNSPAEVVTLAAEAGLSGLALTDHDTVAGWEEARRAATGCGLDFVPGIELSTGRGPTSVHLLGLWVDRDRGSLAEECARLRGERARRLRAMLAKLAALGIDVDEARVRRIAGEAPLGRPHLAAALVEVGAVADAQTAFDDLIGSGRPAWEPKRALDTVAGIGLIRNAGGVAILAHPGISGGGGLDVGLFDELADAGLAGVEAEHPHHDAEVVEHWQEQAMRRDLLVTGSSDFHGARKDARIGVRTTSVVVVDALKERRGEPSAPSAP